MELNVGAYMSRLAVMGKFKPIIIDEGLCELLGMVDVLKLPFGSLPQVPVMKKIQNGVGYPWDMLHPDLKIVQG